MAIIVCGLLLGLTSAPASAEDTCPNAALRSGIEKELPDCRAYEIADMVNKQDASGLFQSWGTPDGNHLSWSQATPTPGSGSGQYTQLLSTRTDSGWVPRTLGLPQADGDPVTLFSPGTGQSVNAAAFSNDYRYGYTQTPFTGDSRDQDHGGVDIYRQSIANGTAELAALPEIGDLTAGIYAPDDGTHTGPPGSYLVGVSADGSRVFFVTRASFSTAPGTPADTHDPESNQLYLRTGGHTYAEGILPDGTQPCGVEIAGGNLSELNNQYTFTWGSVAPDGSNVVFRTPGIRCPTESVRMWLRDVTDPGAGPTIPLSGTAFAGRSDDGKVVFTIDPYSVYAYDTTTGLTRTLYTDPDASGCCQDNVRMLAWSRDGSRVYIADTNGPTTGLYLIDDTGPHLVPGTEGGGITRVSSNQGVGHVGIHAAEGWSGPTFSADAADTPVATPDGTKLLFLSADNLTSYDADGQQMAYIYDATTGHITCISCPADGRPVTARAGLGGSQDNQLVSGKSPLLSDDGTRAVFTTRIALDPRDTNGATDVYEWEDGKDHLLSSGQGTSTATVVGASTGLRDVFIRTADRLVPEVGDYAPHVYDARVDGGFDYSKPTYGCDAGACQPPPSATPPASAPASAEFSGPGNSSPSGARFRLSVLGRASATRNGKAIALVIRLPEAGSLVVTGRGVKRTAHDYETDGLRQLRVPLTAASRRALKRHAAMPLRLTLRYAPVTGDASSQTIRLRAAR